MNNFLNDIGIMTIVVFILLGMKKINYVLSQKKISQDDTTNDELIDDDIYSEINLISEINSKQEVKKY